MIGHSKLGASSMARWAACPGSVRACDGLVAPSSSYAAEGTTAHELAATWLTTGTTPTFPTTSMADAVTTYVEYVRQRAKDRPLYIEHRFDLCAVHPGCYGTADAVVWVPETRTLVVLDFKYGAGLFVSAVDNLQLQYYALGALKTCGFPADTIEQVIVQPRYDHPEGPIRAHRMDARALDAFEHYLKQCAAATEHPDAPLIPGDHCRFCPAAPTCPALLATSQAVAKLEFQTAQPYDPAQLKRALDTIPAVKAWIKAVDEFAYAEAEAGRCPPGYKLVEKRAMRKWRDEAAAEAALKHRGLTAAALYEPRALKSPAQLEKDGIKETVWGAWAEKVSSGHTLVPTSDKRPAVKVAAKDEFQQLAVGAESSL